MNLVNGEKCLFAGQIVTVRGQLIHSITKRVSYLIEHADGSYSRAGAETLAPINPPVDENESAFSSLSSQLFRKGEKRKVLFK